MTTLPLFPTQAEVGPLAVLPMIPAAAGEARPPAPADALAGFSGVLEDVLGLCAEPATVPAPTVASTPVEALSPSPTDVPPPELGTTTPLRFNPPFADAAAEAVEPAPAPVGPTIPIPVVAQGAAPRIPRAPSPARPATAETVATTSTVRSLRMGPVRVAAVAEETPDSPPTADAPLVSPTPRAADVPDDVRALAVPALQASPAERPREVIGAASGSGAPASPAVPVPAPALATPVPARGVVAEPGLPLATGAPFAPPAESAVRADSERPEACASPGPLAASTEVAPKTRTRLTPSTLVEKIAVPPTTPAAPIAGPSLPRTNNKFLIADEQPDAEPVPERGTGNAKSSVDMKSAFESSPRFNAEPAAVTERVIPATVALQVMGRPGATAEPVVETPRPEISLHAADAASVVRNVVDLTHEFRMRDRGSVEVKFNFKDATELTVRLAYRNGDVHTTFRTDSAELRTALGKEWAEYAASFAQEARDYKIADPVFTGSGDFSNAPRDRDTGSSPREHAQPQSSFAHSDQSGHGRAAQRQAGVFRSSPAAPASPAQADAAPRLSTDRLLHVFA